MVVLRLYMAVRDRNWDTIPAHFTTFKVEDGGDRFRVEFTAEHVSDDVDFAWNGTIDGGDGVITCSMAGEPRKTFLKNRIGFCVLHPMSVAGVPATVTTPGGVIEGRFPELISPDQPFIDMTAIEHPVGEQGRSGSSSRAICSRSRISGTGPTPPSRPTRPRSEIRTRSR